jgi:hypothetical protein
MRSKITGIRAALLLAAGVWGQSAGATQVVVVGLVTNLQPSFMPGLVTFQMNNGAALCPAGTWLHWQNADPENNKAVYDTLMAALLNNKTVRLYFDDQDATCTGAYVQILSK